MMPTVRAMVRGFIVVVQEDLITPLSETDIFNREYVSYISYGKRKTGSGDYSPYVQRIEGYDKNGIRVTIRNYDPGHIVDTRDVYFLEVDSFSPTFPDIGNALQILTKFGINSVDLRCHETYRAALKNALGVQNLLQVSIDKILAHYQ